MTTHENAPLTGEALNTTIHNANYSQKAGSLPAQFAALEDYKQFMLYRLVPRENGGTDKLPVSPYTLEVASAHDPANWVDADTACNLADLCGPDFGVAFVFTENDPFYFVDIDHCLSNGQWSPVALELCQQLNGAAVEVSQSKNGLHIIGTGKAPAHSCKNQAAGLELYTEGRFVALTGTNAIGSAAADNTRALNDNVIPRWFPPATTADATPEQWSDTPAPDWSGPEDDDVLLDKMLNSATAASVFGNRATFRDLWENNVEVLARAYPPLNDVDPYDRSSADAALAQHLAFWTGKNHERIFRLMNRSALVRDKWTKHKKYLKEMTITRAVNKQKLVYNNGATKQVDGANLEHLTDLGNAKRLVHQFGANIRYCHETKKWHVWDGRRWIIDNDGMIERIAKKTTQSIYSEAGNQDTSDRREAIAKHAARTENVARLEAMIKLARSETGIPISLSQLDSDHYLLAINKGVINLKNGELIEARADHYITKHAHVDYSPSAACPVWLECLNRIFAGDAELIAFVQRAIGYSLTGDTREQVLFFLYGNGANGKSTIINAIKEIMGDHGRSCAGMCRRYIDSQASRGRFKRYRNSPWLKACYCA